MSTRINCFNLHVNLCCDQTWENITVGRELLGDTAGDRTMDLALLLSGGKEVSPAGTYGAALLKGAQISSALSSRRSVGRL